MGAIAHATAAGPGRQRRKSERVKRADSNFLIDFSY
jgi:hypothetical protein